MKWAVVASSLLFVSLACESSAMADAALKPPLTSLGFLVGEWKSDDGKVADIGGTSKGGSTISVQSDGTALLRLDHTELFGKTGKPAGSFHQTMLIYGDNGSVRADYVDGTGHAIHYVSADITPGKAVTFSSAPGQGPIFSLHYELKSPTTLSVTFGMLPPGQATLRPLAVGTLHKVP